MAFGISQLANGQEKYAVLITGDYAATGIPASEQWNHGQDRGVNGFDEFWNDTFLMWEMLQDKGYSPGSYLRIVCRWTGLPFYC